MLTRCSIMSRKKVLFVTMSYGNSIESGNFLPRWFIKRESSIYRKYEGNFKKITHILVFQFIYTKAGVKQAHHFSTQSRFRCVYSSGPRDLIFPSRRSFSVDTETILWPLPVLFYLWRIDDLVKDLWVVWSDDIQKAWDLECGQGVLAPKNRID